MSVRKLSVSLSHELADALDALADERGDDRSRLVEVLLREHPMVRRRIRRSRREDEEDDLKEAVLAGRAAARSWERRTEAGEVRVRDR